MHYGDNRPKYIRWAIYCLLISFFVLLQNSPDGLFGITGAGVLITIPLCVAVAMFEREVPAAIFGAFAGVLWDISSGADGFNALVLMAVGAICSLLVSHLMRNNVITSLVLGAGGVAAYEIAYIAVRFWGASNPIRQIFTFYFPTFLLTVALVPVCYALIKFVYNSYRIAE